MTALSRWTRRGSVLFLRNMFFLEEHEGERVLSKGGEGNVYFMKEDERRPYSSWGKRNEGGIFFFGRGRVL